MRATSSRDELLTAEQVKERWTVDDRWLRDARYRGRLSYVKLGHRTIRYPESALLALEESGYVKARHPDVTEALEPAKKTTKQKRAKR